MKLTGKKFKLELPGHIKNALSSIYALRKELDLVINVVDSRFPSASDVYEDLLEIFPGVKILNIASKPDLSNVPCKNSFDLRNSKNRSKILDLIKLSLKEKDEMYKKRNYVSHFQILVVGLPNVGKSTLINLLRNKKIAISENRPGVTKKIVKHHLGDNLWLYDSPGIFMHENADKKIIDKLFLINAIPSQFSNYSDTLEWAFLYLKKYYSQYLFEIVGSSDFKDYKGFLNLFAKKFNFKFKDGVLDLERAENKFLNFIRSGKIKIFWDLDAA